ncbi:MAG: DNA primase [Acidobacteriota bacterium]
MGGYQRKDFIERIRASADIVSTISDYVPLKKSGRRYKALCPFHSEKTPSFMVDPEKQLFHCFGCGEGGDVFKFVMLHEKVEFMEAARVLASRWGIEEPEYTPLEKGGNKENIFQVVAEAERFFVNCLKSPQKGKRAQEYLKTRGIRPETVEALKIGYAPDEWEALTNYLTRSKGLSLEHIVAAGLSIQRSDRSAYDRFRNRLIFPIRSLSGKTIGFGGRILGESEEAKYINSPDSPIFNKSYNLYGLNFAAGEIKAHGYAILVEGYMDFAALFEAGIKNCVASLGTSLTTGHAGLIKRFTNEVIVNYDPDSAGRAATIRSLDILLSQGMRVKVMTLPEGQDPDRFVREEGVRAYMDRVKSARFYIDHLIAESSKGKDLRDPSVKVSIINEVLPHLSVIDSPMERSRYIPALCDALKIEDHVLLDEIKRLVKKGKEKIHAALEAPLSLREAEAKLIDLLIDHEDCRNSVLSILDKEDYSDYASQEIIDTVLKMHHDGEQINYLAVSNNLKDEKSRRILRMVAFGPKWPGNAEEALECINSFRLSKLKTRRLKIQREMEMTNDERKLADLMKEKMELSRQIDALS